MSTVLYRPSMLPLLRLTRLPPSPVTAVPPKSATLLAPYSEMRSVLSASTLKPLFRNIVLEL